MIAGDLVLVTSYEVVESGEENAVVKRFLVAVDRTSGEVAWSKEIAPPAHEDPYTSFLETEHGYASNTPVVAGDRIFAFYGKAGVVAYDFAGEELWTTNVGDGSSQFKWGSAASPVAWNDLVFVNASEESKTLFALDQQTGETVWKLPADGNESVTSEELDVIYSTPVVVTARGQDELVMTANNRLLGLDPATGDLLWSAKTEIANVVCASPLAGNDVVYAFGGRGAPSVAVTPGGSGDVSESNILWTSGENSGIPTPVLSDGLLYWADNDGIVHCVDAATGDGVYKERLPDVRKGEGRVAMAVYASPIAADGRIYFTTRHSGVYVVEAGPEFKLLAHNAFESDASQFNATPAVDGDALYLRSNEYLYCIAGD